jgi:hypothetical protein
MATKPGTFFTHATLLKYSVGPAFGFDTKLPVPDIPNGYVPGQGVSAEQVNQQMSIIGDWLTNWLILGSAVAGLDAHLVETNGSGETRVATGIFGGTLAAGPGLVVTENAGIQSMTVFNSKPNGNALEIGATSTIAAAIVTNNGVGPGLTVDSVGGEGARVTAGGSLTGGVFTGGPGGGTGVTGIGLGTGHGLNGVAGPGGCGVQAIGVATSFLPAAAFFGSLFPAAQVRGTWYAQPTVVPSAPIDGDFWKRPGTATIERGGLEWEDAAGTVSGGAAGKQRAHSTTNGFGYGYAESLGDTSEDATSTLDKVTLAMGQSAGQAAQPDGDYIVEFSATIRLGVLALIGTRAIVNFIYPGGSVSTRMDFNIRDERKTVSYFIKHRLINPAGPDLFKIQIASDAGAPGVTAIVLIDNARIVARGSYE